MKVGSVISYSIFKTLQPRYILDNLSSQHYGIVLTLEIWVVFVDENLRINLHKSNTMEFLFNDN